MKPVWQTSEFWISLITQIIGILVLAGGIASQDADKIKTLGTEVIGGVMSLVALIQYVKSRTALKTTIVAHMPPVTEYASPDRLSVGTALPATYISTGSTLQQDRYKEALRNLGI